MKRIKFKQTYFVLPSEETDRRKRKRETEEAKQASITSDRVSVIRGSAEGVLGLKRGSETSHLEDSGPKGVRKQDTPLCRRFLKACSTNLASDEGSTRQNEPLPGSSCERGTLIK